MSRVAKQPIKLPTGVQVQIDGAQLTVKGAKATLNLALPQGLSITNENGVLSLDIASLTPENSAIAGTIRALLNNMVTGVSQGFQVKLELVGVGYKAQAQGKVLNLTLGYSHPIVYPMPEGVTVETPTQTEILVKGADRQQVGQVAAKIRGYRPPEPYKGKGVRYSGEAITIKETKKKK